MKKYKKFVFMLFVLFSAFFLCMNVRIFNDSSIQVNLNFLALTNIVLYSIICLYCLYRIRKED